jgi:hypothetical protein
MDRLFFFHSQDFFLALSEHTQHTPLKIHTTLVFDAIIFTKMVEAIVSIVL